MLQLSPGVIVAGNYRLDAVVGSGATGTVWKATDLALGRTVALKVLHADLGKDPDLQERFKREARLLASLEHPAIVPIYTWLPIEDDKGKVSPCIVMPYLQGKLLSEVLKERPMTVPEVVNVARALLDGLSSAHGAGIIHRDLKPQNVMLETRGNRVHARILDFGIARSSSSPVTALSIVAVTAGRWLGTPEYMSPEQMADPTNVDARADLWAIAVLLFEMLSGQLPFQGRSRVEVVSKILAFAPVSLNSLKKQLPPGLEAFFSRCFAKDIDKRPANCEEMLALFESAAGVLSTPSGSFPAMGSGSWPAVNTPPQPPPQVPSPLALPSFQQMEGGDPRTEPTLVGAPPIPTTAPTVTEQPTELEPPPPALPTPLPPPPPMPPPSHATPLSTRTVLQFNNTHGSSSSLPAVSMPPVSDPPVSNPPANFPANQPSSLSTTEALPVASKVIVSEPGSRRSLYVLVGVAVSALFVVLLLLKVRG